jgi:hypothetical protein
MSVVVKSGSRLGKSPQRRFVETSKSGVSRLALQLDVGHHPRSLYALMEASSVLRRLAYSVVVMEATRRSLGRCRKLCASASRDVADACAGRS